MVRLFLTPNFSPVTTLMQCTPWITVKVTAERTAVPVHVIQRIAALGLCLLFWKTLLPLSIGFAVWYQLHEARNEQIQDEIELIEDNPGLLKTTELLPQTQKHLAARGNIPLDLRFKHLPIENASLERNGTLQRLFPSLPKEKQQEIAKSSSNNLMWALELAPSSAKNLGLNPFDQGDEVAAVAFEKLSIEDFKALVTTSDIPSDLLKEPESCLVRAIGACNDQERLKIFATRYPVGTVRILEPSKWEWLGESRPIARAKARVQWEIDSLRIHELHHALKEGVVDIWESDIHLIERLYQDCKTDEKQNLLRSIQDNLPALNNLCSNWVSSCFDFSFVEDSWFEETFPKLNATPREGILFSKIGCKYINRDRVLEHAPLESWQQFAVVSDPISRPESPVTPRRETPYLIRAVAQSTLYHNESLITHISDEHFQKIFTNYTRDPYRLLEKVLDRSNKVRWLINTYHLDPKRCADILSSQKVSDFRILDDIATEDLYCKNELLKALNLEPRTSPKEELVAPDEGPTANGDSPGEVQGKKGVLDYLEKLGADRRKDLYQRLIDQETSTAVFKELEEQAEGATARTLMKAGKSVLKAAVGLAADLTTHNFLGTELSSHQESLGNYVASFLVTNDFHPLAPAMIDLLLSTCSYEEMQDLCALAPAPVLYHLALRQEARDFSALIKSASKLVEEDYPQIARLLLEKQRYAELVALITSDQHIDFDSLIPSLYYKITLCDALSPEQFEQIAEHLSDDAMRSIINHCKEEKVYALFDLRPEDSLKVGGVALANKVNNTETWNSLEPKLLFKAGLPLATVLGEPISKERLQIFLRACPDNPPSEILKVLSRKEHIDWALEVLSDKAGANLVTSIVKPAPRELVDAHTNIYKESKDTYSLRTEVLEAYAHKIPPNNISWKLLFNKPARALFALRNRAISAEQRAAYICAGAESEDVARFICDKPDWVNSYVTHINELNPLHVWIVVAKSNDTVLAQLGTLRKPEDFPMPRGPEQWRCALKVGAFKDALVKLISRWKRSCPDEYEAQIQQLEEQDKQVVQDASMRSESYYDSSYASDFGAQKTHTRSSLSSSVATSADQANGVAGKTFGSSATPPGTPIAEMQPPTGFYTPETVVPRDQKTPRTIERLQDSTLPAQSPLQQLARGKVARPIPPMPALLTDEEDIAEQVIEGTLDFATAQERSPDFFKKLPNRVVPDPGADFDSQDTHPFYLGKLCLTVSFDDFKLIVNCLDREKMDQVSLFLGDPQHKLAPADPKLSYIMGASSRRSSVQRSPKQERVSSRVTSMQARLSAEEKLAKQVIEGELDFAKAQQTSPDFFKQLPSRAIPEPGADFESQDTHPFYLGELCLKVSFDHFKLITDRLDKKSMDQVSLFLGDPQHELAPTNPKLSYIMGASSRRSSVQRSPQQSRANSRSSSPTNGTPPVFG